MHITQSIWLLHGLTSKLLISNYQLLIFFKGAGPLVILSFHLLHNYLDRGWEVVFFYLFFIFFAMPHGLWDPSRLTRAEPAPSAVKAPSPNHCTARELPVLITRIWIDYTVEFIFNTGWYKIQREPCFAENIKTKAGHLTDHILIFYTN